MKLDERYVCGYNRFRNKKIGIFNRILPALISLRRNMYHEIGNDIYYVGVNDHQVDLFEGQYVVPNGMSYNSYVIMDEKIAVMDTVDANFKDEWLENVARVLDGAKPDYLVVQHMEPDHAANIENFMKAYPDTTVVANTKTFTMMGNFFRNLKSGRKEAGSCKW